jgi:hypothetical protein
MTDRGTDHRRTLGTRCRRIELVIAGPIDDHGLPPLGLSRIPTPRTTAGRTADSSAMQSASPSGKLWVPGR